MKIGVLAPLIESCPPKLYGGTERVVASICDELVARGNDVSLFASGDSTTKADLIPVVPEALRLANPPVRDRFAYVIKQLGMIMEQAREFDIIHNHQDYVAFPTMSFTPCPCLTTLHGRLDLNDSRSVFGSFLKAPLVSISMAQRKPLLNNNWVGNIYHGIDVDFFQPQFEPGNYFAFLGRICPEKGIERAIKVSLESGIPLKIAAKVDKVDAEYYESAIKAQIDGSHIEYIGEIAEHEKSEFLGNALALLFTIDWPEPFGLAVIESYACGTPVLTTPMGSMPEIVENGVTGFLGSDTAAIVQASQKIESLSRRKIRQIAQEKYSTSRMVSEYLKLYQLLTNKNEEYKKSSKESVPEMA